MKRKVLIGVALLLVVPLLAGCGGVAQEDLDAAVAERDAALADVASLQSDLDAANAAKATLQSDLDAAESDLAAAEGDLSSAQSAKATAESALAAAEAEIADLEAQIAELEAPAEEEEEVADEEEEEAVTGLSFTPVTYTNADYGFSLQYPDTWAEKAAEDLDEGVVWRAGFAATYYLPAVKLVVWDEADGATLEEVYTVVMEAWGKSVASFEASDVTINDTALSKGVVACGSAYGDYDSIVVGLIQDGNWVIIEVYGIAALGGVWPNDTMPEEIINTVTFD